MITSYPKFRRNVNNTGKILTEVCAAVTKGKADGYERMQVRLNFWSSLALGATGLRVGNVVVLDGRLKLHPTTYRKPKRMEADCDIDVDSWSMRDDDPLGVMEQLRQQKQAREASEKSQEE